MSGPLTTIAIGLHAVAQNVSLTSTLTNVLEQPMPYSRCMITILCDTGLATAIDATLFGSGALLLSHYASSGPRYGSFPITIPLLPPNEQNNLSLDYVNGNLMMASSTPINLVLRAFVIPANASLANCYAVDSLVENISGSGVNVNSSLHIKQDADFAGNLTIGTSSSSNTTTVYGNLIINPQSTPVSLITPASFKSNNLSVIVRKTGQTVCINIAGTISSQLLSPINIGDYALFSVNNLAFVSNYNVSGVLSLNNGSKSSSACIYAVPANPLVFVLRLVDVLALGTSTSICGSICYMI